MFISAVKLGILYMGVYRLGFEARLQWPIVELQFLAFTHWLPFFSPQGCRFSCSCNMQHIMQVSICIALLDLIGQLS